MTDEPRPGTGSFTGPQWAEVCVFIVVIWTQVILQLAFGAQLAAFLLGLVGLALVIHMLTWMVPMIRRRYGKRTQ